ncbi:GIY-YIG nuclease family protein [Glaciihabitans sp. dw_435]|uniref:GIY-YIG nuclease family protein n=1 Tax=Glaciihabitans sp. dw_435 TaxID=2720081 RepID=UPI001BD34C59|nr:hypothetical protein [Glaciihabitans sp. dw_435]
MTIIEEHAIQARITLSAVGWVISDAATMVGSVPGLYSIHAAQDGWAELGLDYRAGIPLYVGKSESNLAHRELGQHFAINPAVPSRTGGSTVRRSFAALLREPLGLRGVPRNKDNPERFANFGLEPDGDHLLTQWMHEHLTLAVWPMPNNVDIKQLGAVEIDVIKYWVPPLNIKDNPGRLRHLRVARAQLAADARAWASRGHPVL